MFSGAAYNLQHRFKQFADYFKVYMCRDCHTFVDFANPNLNFFVCSTCAKLPDHDGVSSIRTVIIPFTLRIMLLELLSAGISIKLELTDDTDQVKNITTH